MAGRRRALIVANDEYDHPGLARLRAPAADATALAEVLGAPEVGGFEVEVVRNGTSYEVAARVEDLFATGVPDDLLLVHFSCHGLKSDSGELFLAARNTRPDRLGSTAVAAGFVQRCLRGSRARSVVLLLDCCYGSAFGEGVAVRAGTEVNVLDSFPAEKLGGGRGRAVITAAGATQFAFEGDQLAEDRTPGPSVFTSAVVEGLSTGEADHDEDGFVSINELYDFIYDRVRAHTPHQTPGRDIEMQGELYLARSRRRRLRPEPIPPDLRAAVGDVNVFTRLGAVAELRSRAASPDLGVAAGALDVLREIARTDVQYVANAASRAVDESALGVLTTNVAFGLVSQGTGPVVKTVGLTGPPLARSVRAAVSAPWLSADVTPDEVLVRVDTQVVGHLQGVVSLEGPAGSADIRVEAQVRPGAPPGDTELTAPPRAEPPAAATTPERSQPRESPSPNLSGAAPSTTPPASPAPAADASAAPDTRPPADADGDAAARRWFVRAGLLTLSAAALLLVFTALLVPDEGWPLLFGVALAAALATAGSITWRWRERPLAGPGALVGAGIPTAAFLLATSLSTYGPLVLVTVAAQAAGVVAALAGIGRSPDLTRGRRQGPAPVLVLAGLTCTLWAYAWYASLRGFIGLWVVPTSGLVVAGLAAVLLSRLLAAALLVGWVSVALVIGLGFALASG